MRVDTDMKPLPSIGSVAPRRERVRVDAQRLFCERLPMPVELIYPHIAKTEGEPARLEGHPRTRVSMIVADYLWRGWSAEEIVRQYAYLTLAEVHAALAWYFDHTGEIDRELAAEYRDVEQWREAHPTPGFLARLKAQQST